MTSAQVQQHVGAVTQPSPWTRIVEGLAGKPPPPLPALPGRRCRGLHDPAPGVDPVRQQWDAAERKLPRGWWRSLP